MRHAFVILCATLVASPASAAAPPQPGFEKVRPLLDQFCFKCHNAEKAKAGINLTKYTDEKSLRTGLKTWTDLVRVVHGNEMPPEDKPQPTAEQRELIVSWTRGALDRIDHIEDPGRVMIRRLTRTEYNNTVADLLGVTTHPADKFPSDGGGGEGFDNNSSVLFIPPILMEKYMAAADDVLAAAPADRLFPVKPEPKKEGAAARKTLERFVRRAYRRAVEPAEVDRVMRLVNDSLKKGDGFESAVRLGMKAVLVSPSFLFRIERDQPKTGPYLLSDDELANRLSYFIWSSMPDDELSALADQKKLRDPAVIAAQVKRMLASDKSRALAEQFAGQWLGIRDLAQTSSPERGKFPQYTDSLRDAMIEEAIGFFQNLLREDRPVLDLLDCNYTFVNEELSKIYGIEGVQGPQMRKVELHDANRGGLVTMAAIAVHTSYPYRTSPVLRGKWVLEQILGTPAPPPPPMVKSLNANDKPEEGKTFRQRLEAHRQDPNCAGCHAKMDPLGFGLENIDVIGRWRDKLGDVPVDSSGKLTTGESFKGPAELKKILMTKKEIFTRNLTEKMLGYSLGRALDYYDAPAVKKITAALAANGYRGSVLVSQIATSLPFRYRRNDPIEPSP
jgi:hypothetical protein